MIYMVKSFKYIHLQNLWQVFMNKLSVDYKSTLIYKQIEKLYGSRGCFSLSISLFLSLLFYLDFSHKSVLIMQSNYLNIFFIFLNVYIYIYVYSTISKTIRNL